MVDTRIGVLEPVHWGARLVRSEDFSYTEVDGTPLLVRPSDGEVRALTPTWAAIWAQLDGRPVTEALQVEPGSLGPVDARNLIEVLRRLKASEVIADAEPSRRTGEPDNLGHQDELRHPVKVSLAGSVSRGPDGTTVRIDPSGPDRVVVKVAHTADGARMSIRRRLRRRRIDYFQVTDGRNPADRTTAVERFATLIEALEDRSVLVTPGLIDLLAEVAERAGAPAPLPR